MMVNDGKTMGMVLNDGLMIANNIFIRKTSLVNDGGTRGTKGELTHSQMVVGQ